MYEIVGKTVVLCTLHELSYVFITYVSADADVRNGLYVDVDKT
jgi:hypothetical protein